jgi:tripeptidyl-peptidase-1
LNDADLKEILGAPTGTIEKVKTWLMSNGVDETDIVLNDHEDILRVVTKVGVAESLLKTDLVAFYHGDSQVRLVRAATPYYLPEEISEHVSLVGDLMRLPQMDVKKPAPVVLDEKDDVFNWYNALFGAPQTWANDCDTSSCSGKVTPGVIRERYNIGDDASSSKNSMAVAEFQYQYYDQKILDNFNNKCHVDSTPANVIGGNNPSQAGVEALLDIEFIKAAAPEVDLTIWYSSDYSLLQWATDITEMDNAPYVWSVSYGNDEAQQTGADYMNQCSVQFQKAGAKGLSILFASGDQGTCGREGCGFFKKKYHPDFPAANPYITAVGGTDFATKGVIGEETSWSESGGGFSDTFDIPSWQADVVAGYKSSATLPKASLYSDTGRGYPDIAALGGEVNTYCVATSSSSFQGVAGTSASCPVAAGIFAKLNGIRLAAGKAPLGWLNPFIYQNADAFNDVTSGSNGFDAIKGWDPVTGFGTPNYEKLAKAVKALN